MEEVQEEVKEKYVTDGCWMRLRSASNRPHWQRRPRKHLIRADYEKEAERHGDHFVIKAQERIYRWLAYSQAYPFLLATSLIVILSMALLVVDHNKLENQQ